jgi:hypothetical protein
VDILAHDPPKCERFGDQIMRDYYILERDRMQNRHLLLLIALWMSRAVALYSMSKACKAGRIASQDHNRLTKKG